MTAAPSSDLVDRAFELMGTHIRILIGAPSNDAVETPEAAADKVEALLNDYNETMSRFRPDSELSRLNEDERAEVPASEMLRSAVSAAIAAANQSGGLVDPTLLSELEEAGYREHWTSEDRLELGDALASGRPAPAAAEASPQSRWREIIVDDQAGVIRRPPGLRIDTGGTGKGHVADLSGELLSDFQTWAVDCGGDVRIGGSAEVPREVQVVGPFGDGQIETVNVVDGAVATSGLNARIWRQDDGSVAHHLIDPLSGRPAFSGLIAATALAPTAIEAETLAKMALLQGPSAARQVLSRYGGITVAEDGMVDRIGQLHPAPRMKITIPSSMLQKGTR